MADEASITIVARMRDEASQEMAALGTTTRKTSMDMQQMQMSLVATGSALTSVGALMNQLESPQLKMIANFLMITGAIMTTVGAIITALPYIADLTASLKSLAIVQSILGAMSGPRGWAMLGIGAVVGTAATVGIMRATGGGGGGGTTTVINNIGGSVITERELGEITRKEIVKNQQRNSSSGVR